MKKLLISAVLVGLTAVVSPAISQDAPPPPIPPPPETGPAPSSKPMLRKAFIISERKMPMKVAVAGKTSVIVELPKDVNAAVVTVQVADRPYTSRTKPYRIEIDFSSIPDGEVIVTASAADESGKEVWKGNTTVIVDNAGKVAGPGPALGPRPPRPQVGVNPLPNPPAPRPGGVPPANNRKPGQISNQKTGSTGELAPLPPALPTEDIPEPPPVPGDEGPAKAGDVPGIPDGPASSTPPVKVTQVFTSEKYGVKCSYPAGWKAVDNSAKVKPKEPGAFWFIFTSPENPPKLTINFRHRLLKNPTTPQKYAKYNPYLLDWATVEVNGKPAFETMQGSEEASRVVHRKMVIDGRHIWMFNCIDQTGKDSFESKILFDQVVNSAIK